MTDLFISYDREDLLRVKALAQLFEAHGWSVWWDRRVPPGRSYADAIERALTDCQCAVVVWSQQSVESRWVRLEAAEADRQRKLVPVMIDPVHIPFEFRDIQAAQLLEFPTKRDEEQIREMLHAIELLAPLQAPIQSHRAKAKPLETRPRSKAAAGRPVLAAPQLGRWSGAVATLFIMTMFGVVVGTRTAGSECTIELTALFAVPALAPFVAFLYPVHPALAFASPWVIQMPAALIASDCMAWVAASILFGLYGAAAAAVAAFKRRPVAS